ncbi:MAG: ribonuclease H-like domain-containing protein [Acidobacteria bacterium]|nr:ribonuclease H-like domain-containing protein [Acidobacteriota bacterium]
MPLPVFCVIFRLEPANEKTEGPLARHRPQKHAAPLPRPEPRRPEAAATEPFLIKEFTYSLEGRYGKVRLGDWLSLKPGALEVISGDSGFAGLDPRRVVFFDSETTGLAGGTGTVAFMLGFGFFSDLAFQVRIFVLLDLDREADFLEAVARFLAEGNFSAAVTYNGKAFDFPLLETRYILKRQRFPLQGLPHLDFLFPARTIWRNTFDSRKLGFLGEMLLGLSREDDVDGSDIPALYFSFLRSRAFSLIEPVVEHNAMDLVGLAAVVLLGVLYLDDYSLTGDGGEIFGLGRLCERAGLLEKAEAFYKVAREASARDDVCTLATRRLSILLKKKKFFSEALELWQQLAASRDPQAQRELSVHFEHRERDFALALSYVEKAIAGGGLTPARQQEMEKRLQRLQRKIAKLEEKEE